MRIRRNRSRQAEQGIATRTSAEADLMFGEKETLILNLLAQRQAKEVR